MCKSKPDKSIIYQLALIKPNVELKKEKKIQIVLLAAPGGMCCGDCSFDRYTISMHPMNRSMKQ